MKSVIHDEADLTVTQRQVQNMELALQSIQKRYLPHSPDWYRLTSEQFIETLRELRSTIDAYLGIDLTKPALADAEEIHEETADAAEVIHA